MFDGKENISFKICFQTREIKEYGQEAASVRQVVLDNPGMEIFLWGQKARPSHGPGRDRLQKTAF